MVGLDQDQVILERLRQADCILSKYELLVILAAAKIQESHRGIQSRQARRDQPRFQPCNQGFKLGESLLEGAALRMHPPDLGQSAPLPLLVSVRPKALHGLREDG